MRLNIYQLKDIRDSEYGFMSYDYAKQHGFKLEDYNLIYSREEAKNSPLDKLFEEFNINRPSDFKGRSLSVSDILELDSEMYYCDDFGWTKIEK